MKHLQPIYALEQFFAFNVVHQPTSASRCAAEPEHLGWWQPHPWPGGREPTALSGVSSRAGQAPITSAEFSSPTVSLNTAEPRLPAAAFTYTFDLCVPQEKSPGVFVPKHSPPVALPPAECLEEHQDAFRALPGTAISPPPKGAPAATPSPARSLGGSSRCQAQRFPGLVACSLQGLWTARYVCV